MAILFNKWLTVLFLMGLMSFSNRKSVENAFHPYHVSATEIEFNKKGNRLEISSKIFTDDLEAVLTKRYKTKADFAEKKLNTQMNDLVKKYITTHLAVSSKGKLMPLQLYGWEQDREAIIVYTTANTAGTDLKDVTVENTILYDQFNDQMNIIHFISGSGRKSTKLNYPDKKASFSF